MIAFRPVFFSLDMFGGRLVLGALLFAGKRVTFVPSPSIDRRAAGLDQREQAVVRMSIEDLRGATDFERLPLNLGPQWILGPTCTMTNDEISNAEDWLRTVMR